MSDDKQTTATYQQKCKVKISTISGSVTGVFLDSYPYAIEQKTEKLIDAIAYWAHPAVTVDSPEFQRILSYMVDPDSEDCSLYIDSFIAHIDAHVAKAVAAEREACIEIINSQRCGHDAADADLTNAICAIRARA